MKTDFTAKTAAEWLSYDFETGKLSWLKGRKAGSVAGSYDGKGYIQISILGGVYKAHRIAWLLQYGEWPNGFIDHINHKTDDNRLSNLRVVDAVLNGQNKIKALSHSSHGFLGVKKAQDGRYESRICVRGKRIALGRYSTPEEAHAKYLEAKRKFHEACTI